MDFTEKLRKASAEVNKTKAGLRAGLKADTISSYITKRAIPRLDTALRIARALNVPLEWLADDSKDWPPPQRQQASLADFTDDEITLEYNRRIAILHRDWMVQLDEADRIDWKAVRRKIKALQADRPVPPDIEKESLVAVAIFKFYMAINHQFALVRAEIPDLPSEEEMQAAVRKYMKLTINEDWNWVRDWRIQKFGRDTVLRQESKAKMEK